MKKGFKTSGNRVTSRLVRMLKIARRWCANKMYWFHKDVRLAVSWEIIICVIVSNKAKKTQLLTFSGKEQLLRKSESFFFFF